MTEATLWVIKGGNLTKLGRPDTPPGGGGGTPPSDRDSLVYGTYQPAQNTSCGVLPGTARTDWNSPGATFVTISAPDPAGPFVNKNFYGDIKYTGNQDVYFYNCLFVGGSTHPANPSGCFDARSARQGKCFFYDCSFIVSTESYNRDCIVGHKYEAYRCYCTKGTDGFGIFVEPAKYSPAIQQADVKIMGCMVENLAYFYPDAVHSDGTHNDCIQHQGGENVHVKGNYLYATAHYGPGSGTHPTKPWLFSQPAPNWAPGSVVIVQEQSITGTISNSGTGVIYENNYLRGGLAHLNVKSNIQFVWRNNNHYRETAISTTSGYTWSGYWIRFDNHTSTVTNVNSGTGNNTWIDGPLAGNVLIEPRTSGIHYDA